MTKILKIQMLALDDGLGASIVLASVRRVFGALATTLMIGISGTAAAELDCTVDTLEALPKEARIERSYACTKERNNSIYLENLARDLFLGAERKGWDPDWQLANQAYRDFIDRAEKLPPKSLGALHLVSAYESLTRLYMGSKYPDDYWPQDLEKANHYADRRLDLERRSGADAAVMAEAYKQKADVEAMIATSVGYIRGDLSHGANPNDIPAIKIGDFEVAIKEIYRDEQDVLLGNEAPAVYNLSVVGTNVSDRNRICLLVSSLTETAIAEPKLGKSLNGYYYRSSLESFAADADFYVDWPEGAKKDTLRIEIQKNTGELDCEWWNEDLMYENAYDW